jgi:hypothetical protein
MKIAPRLPAVVKGSFWFRQALRKRKAESGVEAVWEFDCPCGSLARSAGYLTETAKIPLS